MSLKRKSRKILLSKRIVIALIIVAISIITVVLLSQKYLHWIYGNNISIAESNDAIIFIPENASFDEALDLINREKLLINVNSFKWVAKLKGFQQPLKGGRYKVANGMSNNELINMLRAGLQSPVTVTFNNIRTKKDLAGKLSHKLDLDSSEMVQLLNNDEFLEKYQVDKETALILFIPNSYEFYWTTNASEFITRMSVEYKKFWNEDRLKKAEDLLLTPCQVSILAAIVDEETIKTDEKPMVAGLYINRLNKDIRLQADPTVKYAIGNFNVNRVINKDKLVDSPYNTYIYSGLPPGPIRIPSISGIDAVLNAVDHNYLYMCAKEDFSGYHNFAKTLEQHNQNAAKYRRELNKRRIWR